MLRESEAETRRAGGNAADVLLLEAKVARLREDPVETFSYTAKVLAALRNEFGGHEVKTE